MSVPRQTFAVNVVQKDKKRAQRTRVLRKQMYKRRECVVETKTCENVNVHDTKQRPNK